MKVAIPLTKNVLASLGITAAASAIDSGIQNKNTWFWKYDFDNFKWNQALEDSNILLKGVTKTIKNETKEQKEGFLSMLLGTLGASLLGNLLAGKGIVKAGSGCRSLNSSTSYENKKGKGIARVGSGRPSSSALQKQWYF